MPLADEFVKSLAEAAWRPNTAPWPPENVCRFRLHVQEAGANWASYTSPTILRREIKKLNGLAGLVIDPQRRNTTLYKQLLTRKMKRVLAHVQTMSPEARCFLSERLQLRSQQVDLASEEQKIRIAMLDAGNDENTSGDFSSVALYESFRDPLLFVNVRSLDATRLGKMKREAYLWHLFSVTQIERRRVKGRARPNGKISRQSSIATLYVPTSISRYDRIRELEMHLAVAWLELTGSKPNPDDYYIAFVEQVLAKLKIRRVDTEKLVAMREGRSSAATKMNEKPVLSGRA